MNKKIEILVADITTIKADAIVNAANSSLLGGGGVDGAIHRAGGSAILNECRELRATTYPDGLSVGAAAITTAGDLPAKYVIHTVGPQYRFDNSPQKHLKSCYKNSFSLADKYKCHSIAFSSIATGIYGFPKQEAAKIAYETINNLLPQAKNIEEVLFVFHSQDDADIFKNEVN